MHTNSSEIISRVNTWPTSNILRTLKEERLANIPLLTKFEQRLGELNITQQGYLQNATLRQLVILQAYGEVKRSACPPLVRKMICRP